MLGNSKGEILRKNLRERHCERDIERENGTNVY